MGVGYKALSLLFKLRLPLARRLLERRRSFQFGLSVGCMMKNEAAYLEEWMTFHIAMGVDHFFLVDDHSTDNSFALLESWVADGKVTLIRPRKRVFDQWFAYRQILRRARFKTKWLAFLDVDEFLFSPKYLDLQICLQKFEHSPAVFVYWVLYGSGGRNAKPNGSVVENFTRCLPLNLVDDDSFAHRAPGGYVTGWARDGKSIVNPRAVWWPDPHYPKGLLWGQVVDENGDAPVIKDELAVCPPTAASLRINHYWSKSLEELRERVYRENIAGKGRPKPQWDRLLERERGLNHAVDPIAQEILRKVSFQRIRTETVGLENWD